MLKYALHVAILLGFVVAAVRYLNGEEVLNALQNFQYSLAAPILIISLIFMALKAARFVFLMKPFSEKAAAGAVFKGYLAGDAATLLPGGIAARIGLMKQIGVPLSESGIAVAVNSLLDQAVLLAGSVAAAYWFPPVRTPAAIITAIVVILALLLFVPAFRHGIVNLGAKIAGRFDQEKRWRDFVAAVPRAFQPHIILPALGLSILALASQVVMLDLSLRGIGVQLNYPQLALVTVLPVMLGRVVPVPGGVGVTEGSMVGLLASTAGLDPNQGAAAVAVFRVAYVFFTALVGALIYFFLWRGDHEVAIQSRSVP